MKKMRRLLVLITTVVSLSACGDDVESDLKVFDSLLQWMQIGSSQDQWLEQYSRFLDEWDRVVLVFGFADDRDGCEMLVKALRVTEPLAQYRCVRAN